MKRILSAIKPSGLPHIGNYFGAMRQHIQMQERFESYIFIADLHSLITQKDPEKLKEQIYEVALTYLALGLDPGKAVLFKQSDISAHAELCWIFNCITQMPFLERGHAWKDAKAKGKKDTNVGLFNYPVLMAADILLYSPDLVPVGKDQKQHIEMARDIAQTFNHTYKETFKIPEPHILKEVETILGTDGEKMSKSYSNTIKIFASEKDLKSQIMSIITDSKELEDPKDPETCNVYNIYKHFASDAELKEMSDNYKAGGYGYGHAKKALLEKILQYFAEAREKYAELKPQKDYIMDIVNEGTKKAKLVAEAKLEEVKVKIGLL